MSEQDKIKDGKLLFLGLLERISWTDNLFRKFQKNKDDGDFIISVRECALQDWRFIWTMSSCPHGCLHEHGEEWKKHVKDAIERIGEHRDQIHEWLSDRSKDNPDKAYPSICTHGDSVDA